MILELNNPINITPRDKEDLNNFFNQYEIVPYYGTQQASSQGFMDLLNTLAELSPTFKAYRRDINSFCFGHNLDFVGSTMPGLALDNEELDPENKIQYASWLGEIGLPPAYLLKLSKRIDNYLDISGNAFLWIKRSRIGSATRYSFKVPHFLNVGYLRQQSPLDFALVSPYLGDMQKIIENGIKILPVSQMDEEIVWGENAEGVEETLLHIKREDYNSRSIFYERSPLIPIITDLYADYKHGELRSKIAATDIITLKLLAFEGPDPNTFAMPSGEIKEINNVGQAGKKDLDYFDRNMLILREITSNLGAHPSKTTAGPGQVKKSSSIAGIEYPNGSQPPTSIDLQVNRDKAYHEWQTDKAEAKICSTLGWNSTILGLRDTKSNIGGNVVKDLFEILNVRTIIPRQIELANIWDSTINQLKDNSQFTGYGIQYTDIITSLVDRIAGSPQEAVQEPQEGSEPDLEDIDNQTIEDNE